MRAARPLRLLLLLLLLPLLLLLGVIVLLGFGHCARPVAKSVPSLHPAKSTVQGGKAICNLDYEY